MRYGRRRYGLIGALAALLALNPGIPGAAQAVVCLAGEAVPDAFQAADTQTADAGGTQAVLLHPHICSHSISAYENSEDTGALADVMYPEVLLPEAEQAGYGSLAAAVADYNEQKKETYENTLTGLADSAAEINRYAAGQENAMTDQGAADGSADSYEGSGYDYSVSCTQEIRPQIARADSVLFSVLEHYSCYLGGVHGYYEDRGITFDSRTGEVLSFSQVVTDCDAAAARVMERLRSDYPDLMNDPVFTSPQVTQERIADAFRSSSAQIVSDGERSNLPGAQQDGTGEDGEEDAVAENDSGTDDTSYDYPITFNWYVTPLGVSVVFPPYTLGSYAAGQQTVQLSFEEDPGLFDPKYREVPDSYIVPFDRDAGFRTDINGDGQTDLVKVSDSMDDSYDAYVGRAVSVNGTEYAYSDAYYYSTDCYYVKSAAGKYLYCFDTSDNDYQDLTVYDLSGGEPAKLEVPVPDDCRDLANFGVRSHETYEDSGNRTEYGVSGYYETSSVRDDSQLTDPDAMQLSSRMDAMSTYMGYKTYSVKGSPAAEAAAAGGDGSLVPEGWPVSADPWYMAETSYSLTLLRDMSLTVAGEDGTGTENVTFPASSVFSILRTDGRTFVDLREESDPSVIVRVHGSFDSWPHTVEGMSEDELFSGEFYAG